MVCRLCGFVAALLAFSSGSAGAQPTPDIGEKVDALVRRYAEGRNFSGIVLASIGEDVVFEQTYGMANFDAQIPLTPDTRFFIASLSKSFTAAAILKLQDEGRLSVSDTIDRFLPDYPRGSEITIHHLLTHESGLPRIVFLPEYRELSAQHHEVADVVDIFAGLPLASEPGERYGYSNANYVLLAHLIEIISGMSYGDFLKERILDPLRLEHTGDGGTSKSTDPSQATGHDPVGIDELEDSRYFDFSIMTGAGSLYSTAGDLQTWIRALAAGEVLSAESTRLMFEGPTYGLNLTEVYGRRMVSNSGWSDVGFTSSLTYDPAGDLAVIVLNNIDISSVAGEIGDGVTAILVSDDFQGLDFDNRPVDDSLAASLVGVYRFDKTFFVPDATMEIVSDAGRLYANEPAQNRRVGLLRIGELEFIHRSSWGRVEFQRSEDDTEYGTIEAMRFYRRFEAKKE